MTKAVGDSIWTVDRVEAGQAVLVHDDTEAEARVVLAELPAGCREGAVLRVPGAGGEPDWAHARVDEGLRRERIAEARNRLARLRRRDPGGDVALD